MTEKLQRYPILGQNQGKTALQSLNLLSDFTASVKYDSKLLYTNREDSLRSNTYSFVCRGNCINKFSTKFNTCLFVTNELNTRVLLATRKTALREINFD